MLVLEFQENLCRCYDWQPTKGGHVLKRCLTAPLHKPRAEGDETAAAQKSGAAIRQALKTAGVKAAEAHAVIPKQWVTLRFVTLPSTDAAEIAEMARFEAEKHIPFNVERHVISHYLLSQEGINGAKVIIAALDGPPAQRVTAICAAAGLRLTSIDVSTLALANVFRQSNPPDPETHPTVAQIHIGQSATDITVFHKGEPIFARSIAQGVEKLLPPAEDASALEITPEQLLQIDFLEPLPSHSAEAPLSASTPSEPGLKPATPASEPHEPPAHAAQNWANRLIREIRQTWDFARREYECDPITLISLSGAGCHLKNLIPLLQERLGISILELNPSTPQAQIDPAAQPFPPSTYAIGAGGLLQTLLDDAPRVNLLPPEYIRKHASFQKRQSFIFSVILTTVFLACVFLYCQQEYNHTQDSLARVEEELRKGEEQEKQINYRKKVVRINEEHSRRKGSALGILDDMSSWDALFKRQNMRVSILEFEYTAGRNLKLVGHAYTYEDLNNLRTMLEKSGHFTQVSVESQPKDPNKYPAGGNITLIRYTLNCYLEKEKTEEKTGTSKKTTETD